MSRRRAREMALKVLFQVDVGGADPQSALRYHAAEDGLAGSDLRFAQELVEGVHARRPELDAWVERFALDWRVTRMAGTDRNILRLAIFELLYRPDVPPSVAVNEAVELAKVYGDADSGRFVNGVLGAVLRTVQDPSRP